MTETLQERPLHVPAALVVDFDMYNPEGWAEDVHLAWKRVQDQYPPIFWTPRRGGHWVVTRAVDIKHIEQNYEQFSNAESFVPRGVIPPQLPVNLDPPEHAPFRRLIMPAFLPKSVNAIEVKARAIAIRLIEELLPQGECEFVSAFAGAMPIMAFLIMMDLPEQDYRELREIGNGIARPDDAQAYASSRAALSAYIRRWIAERQANPGSDLISRVVHGEVNERPLTGAEIENLCLLLLGGGLDTVKYTMSFAAHFLARSPAHRRQLLDDPTLIPNAVEEIARRFGTSNLARKVRHDMTYKGVHFAANEMIVLPYPLSGLDGEQNPDPLSVDFTRKPIRHDNFGGGPHTCPGAMLARRELTIFLQEWLPRVPDFHVKPGTTVKFGTGLVNSVFELWLEWTPGPLLTR
jgi:cytochrome P450